jgi:hypothetical protein
MANTLLMDQHFERNKNLTASGITVLVCALLFLLFFLVNWTVPQIIKPDPLQEGIEVNLGNSDVGSGSEQPLVQGSPGPTSNPDNNPQQSSGGQTAPDEKTDDSKDPNGAPATTNKTPTKNPAPTPNPKPVVKPTPAPPAPKPKATFDKSKYGGGDKNGGNNPDTYNKSNSEGNDPNGKGDKGNPNGTPNGKGYTGTGGNGNVRIKGDRKMMYYPNEITNVEPGVVTVSVVVTPEGVGTFQAFLKGTFSATYRSEIIQYLRKVKFNKADHESTIEMTFVFKR